MILLNNKFHHKAFFWSLLLIFGTLNCADDLSDAQPPTSPTPNNTSPQARGDEFLENLNHFAVAAENKDNKFENWLNSSKALLGIEVEAKAKDESTVEKISKPVLSGGKKIQSALGVLGTGAKIASYIGVPFAALVADLASYNNSIRTVRGLIKKVQPKNIEGNLSAAQRYLLGLKKKTIGWSASEKDEALSMLNQYKKGLLDAQEISQEIEKLNLMLELIQKENSHKSKNVLFINLFVKNRFLEHSVDLELMAQMSASLLLSGETIADSLEPFKNEDAIGRSIKELRELAPFVHALSDIIAKTKTKMHLHLQRP